MPQFVYSPPLQTTLPEPRPDERTGVETLRPTVGRGGTERVHPSAVAFVFSLSYFLGYVQSVQVINFYFHRNNKRNWAGRTAKENEIRHRKPIQGQGILGSVSLTGDSEVVDLVLEDF